MSKRQSDFRDALLDGLDCARSHCRTNAKVRCVAACGRTGLTNGTFIQGHTMVHITNEPLYSLISSEAKFHNAMFFKLRN